MNHAVISDYPVIKATAYPELLEHMMNKAGNTAKGIRYIRMSVCPCPGFACPVERSRRHNEIVEMLEELSIPVAYKAFEGEKPEAPYVIFTMQVPRKRGTDQSGFILWLCEEGTERKIEAKLFQSLKRHNYMVNDISRQEACITLRDRNCADKGQRPSATGSGRVERRLHHASGF